MNSGRQLGVLYTIIIIFLACLAVILIVSPLDRDHDGYWNTWKTPIDCDDKNPNINPGAKEIPLNGIDENCDGMDSYKGANVLLIVVDTLRPDHMGCYGYHRNTTPHIDLLASESVLFENAYSNAGWTIPAFASILTGMYPKDHGVNRFNDRLDEDVLTVAEIFYDAEYQTDAYLSLIHISEPTRPY